MTAIGYDDARDALMIMGVGVYQPLTLAATMDEQGFVTIRSMAGRGELYRAWSDISDLAENGFASSDALLTYLQGEFVKCRAVGETFGVATVAGAALIRGLPVAVSRATGQLLPARADTDALAFVAGVASADTGQGFTVQPAHGAVTLPDWSAVADGTLLAPGLPYFLAAAGGLTAVPPGAGGLCTVRVGLAVSSTTMVVAPTLPIQL